MECNDKIMTGGIGGFHCLGKVVDKKQKQISHKQIKGKTLREGKKNHKCKHQKRSANNNDYNGLMTEAMMTAMVMVIVMVGAARRGGCPVQSIHVASPKPRAGTRLQTGPPVSWAMRVSLVLALQGSVRQTIVALGA